MCPIATPTKPAQNVHGTARVEEKRQQDSYRRALSNEVLISNSNRLLSRYRAYSELCRAIGKIAVSNGTFDSGTVSTVTLNTVTVSKIDIIIKRGIQYQQSNTE